MHRIVRYRYADPDHGEEFVGRLGADLERPARCLRPRFGPDGHLYVSTDQGVLRHHGVTAELLDTFVSLGKGGLVRPAGLLWVPRP